MTRTIRLACWARVVLFNVSCSNSCFICYSVFVSDTPYANPPLYILLTVASTESQQPDAVNLLLKARYNPKV